jgi:hypothetical protein
MRIDVIGPNIVRVFSETITTFAPTSQELEDIAHAPGYLVEDLVCPSFMSSKPKKA